MMIERNIFLVNPKAGQGDGNDKFIEKVREIAKMLDLPAEFHKTTGIGEATHYVDRIASESSESIRFFACGGDGTLNEVINGAFGHDNAIVGCIPIGTGNDFVRNFPEAGDFMDITAQLRGKPMTIDLMHYMGTYEGEAFEGYCDNMFNIGFDCNVVDMAAQLKTKPLISGSFAYLLGVAIILIKMKGANLKIELDGKLTHDGPLLLTTIANGCFCGGGVMSNPHARLDDGHFDAQIVQQMRRGQFLRLFPKYSKGVHLTSSMVVKNQLISYYDVNEMKITANGNPFRVSIDGEIIPLDEMKIDMAPKSCNFSVPSK